MSRRGRAALASAVLILCILMLALPASAECAWVLWEQTVDPGGAKTWAVLNAHGPQRDCERFAAPWNEGFMNSMVEHQKRQLQALARDERLPDQKATVFVCFPDTIDPRGPKSR